MGTRKVRLTGLGYWAKVFESNRDETGYEDALKEIGGQTTIDVDLDDENLALLKKSKSMKKGTNSKDNPGLTRVKLTRKWTDQYNEKNGGPPKVVKADGTDWDLDEDGLIGNGSEIEVILTVYDTKRKGIVGTRLEKVKVLKHKAFDRDEEDNDEPAPKPKAKAKQDDFEDSELPF